jgi:hypothetical protein
VFACTLLIGTNALSGGVVTDEADNAIRITVSLPASRLDHTVDPLSCSARRP